MKQQLDMVLDQVRSAWRSREQFRGTLEKLMARGVSIFVFYSGSRRARDMDHTETSHDSQHRLLSMISAWARQVEAS